MDGGIEAARQVGHELGQPDSTHGLLHLGVGGVGPREGDVLAHGAREQVGLLRDDTELPPK